MAEKERKIIALMVPRENDDFGSFKSIGKAYNEAKRKEERGAWRGINEVLVVIKKIFFDKGRLTVEDVEKAVLAFEISHCPFSPESPTFMEDIEGIESVRNGRDVIYFVKEVISSPKKES